MVAVARNPTAWELNEGAAHCRPLDPRRLGDGTARGRSADIQTREALRGILLAPGFGAAKAAG